MTLAVRSTGIYKSMSLVTMNIGDSAAEFMRDFAMGIKAMSAAKRTTVSQHFERQDGKQDIETAI